MLYWHVGRRIRTELLQGQRAEYGRQVVSTLAAHLTREYGKGWSEQQLWFCLQAAERFPDETMNRPEFDGDSVYWELASRAGAGC